MCGEERLGVRRRRHHLEARRKNNLRLRIELLRSLLRNIGVQRERRGGFLSIVVSVGWDCLVDPLSLLVVTVGDEVSVSFVFQVAR